MAKLSHLTDDENYGAPGILATRTFVSSEKIIRSRGGITRELVVRADETWQVHQVEAYTRRGVPIKPIAVQVRRTGQALLQRVDHTQEHPLLCHQHETLVVFFENSSDVDIDAPCEIRILGKQKSSRSDPVIEAMAMHYARARDEILTTHEMPETIEHTIAPRGALPVHIEVPADETWVVRGIVPALTPPTSLGQCYPHPILMSFGKEQRDVGELQHRPFVIEGPDRLRVFFCNETDREMPAPRAVQVLGTRTIAPSKKTRLLMMKREMGELRARSCWSVAFDALPSDESWVVSSVWVSAATSRRPAVPLDADSRLKVFDPDCKMLSDDTIGSIAKRHVLVPPRCRAIVEIENTTGEHVRNPTVEIYGYAGTDTRAPLVGGQHRLAAIEQVETPPALDELRREIARLWPVQPCGFCSDFEPGDAEPATLLVHWLSDGKASRAVCCASHQEECKRHLAGESRAGRFMVEEIEPTAGDRLRGMLDFPRETSEKPGKQPSVEPPSPAASAMSAYALWRLTESRLGVFGVKN